ncbi:glycoside hydrolase family 3 protein [Stackebrandtia nassauensis]|uniref:beta-glucosidase n=1 Tax=Stackebrandtia nassauensis (strain DSM 44728 / CIP 108903 / NRRL B-16338 / NBRC 102104 / LLR-40K-21) TaxID=446470 RepID=D3PWW8_STANL|nr:glycoside hydrolase family 3 domain protein [Stackebrandtia nassauensis DSM 44728]
MAAILSLTLLPGSASADAPSPRDPSAPIDKRVAALVADLTLEEKAGQMTQAEKGSITDPADITTYGLGSILSGGGGAPDPNTPEAWADMIDGYQARALETRQKIPMIYGADAVHGHNNVSGATIMPHNLGLGASRSPELAKRAAEVTAIETRATGVPWTFAPCLCVARDDRWGRTYESFGEDPELVSSMVDVVDGLQGTDLTSNTTVLATAKHFVGDGGTTYGSSTTEDYKIDQGITELTREQLRDLHIAPFETAVDRNVGSVMPSYSSVDHPDDDTGPVKMHANDELINGVLKQELGFQGFVISDWKAIDQIPGDYASDVRTSINAGVDMVMVPYDYKTFISTLISEVNAGRIPMERIDDAVTRILTAKEKLGLFDKPYADRTHIGTIGSAEHRAVAREAAAASQVLLKNDGDALPLASQGKLYVAGSNADDLGNQMGGWSISWQGSSGDTTEGTTILEGIREVAPDLEVTHSKDASAPTDGHDTGLVVVGETPYAEGKGDVGVGGHDMKLSAADSAAVSKVCGEIETCVVVTVSGRPLEITSQLDQMDALVAAWLPGSEGAGVADTLFGDVGYSGKLPVSWPRSVDDEPINVGDPDYDPLFPYGAGLTTD